MKSSLKGEPFSLNPYSELGAHRFKSRIYGKSEEKVSYCQLKYTLLYVTYLYVGPIAKIYSACITLHSRRYTVRVYWPTNKLFINWLYFCITFKLNVFSVQILMFFKLIRLLRLWLDKKRYFFRKQRIKWCYLLRSYPKANTVFKIKTGA